MLNKAPNRASLRSASIFSCLSAEEEQQWLSRCYFRAVGAGETVVDFEDPSKDVFLVQSGELRAVLRFALGKEAILGAFKRGDLVGEIAALDERSRSACLMAVTDTQMTVIPFAVFHEMLETRHEICLALMQLLSRRIRTMNEKVSELAFLDARHRLYNTLLRLSRPRADSDVERVVSPPLVHAELAEHIGSSRETVSREMSRLSQENLVERTSRAIVLKNPAELARRISRAFSG